MLIDPERVGERRSLLPYCLHAIPILGEEDEATEKAGEEREVRRGIFGDLGADRSTQ